MTNKAKKNIQVLIICVAVLFSMFLFVFWESEKLKSDGIQTVARITRVTLNYGSGSSSTVEYEYSIEGKKFVGAFPDQSICSSISVSRRKNLVGKLIPIIFSESKPNVSLALLSDEIASNYSVEIPDSLIEFVESTFYCN